MEGGSEAKTKQKSFVIKTTSLEYFFSVRGYHYSTTEIYKLGENILCFCLFIFPAKSAQQSCLSRPGYSQ